MPFKKETWNGNKEGRPIGSKNVRSEEQEKLKDSVLSVHCERFNNILEDLEGKDFLKVYLKVLQYFKPRMQHSKVEVASTIDTPIKLTPPQIDKLIESL